jgi:hypothetical protein
MVSEKLNLWYCDTFVTQPWQFFFLVIALAGAYFYGRGQQKLGWILIALWVVVTITFSALTNFVFSCNLE